MALQTKEQVFEQILSAEKPHCPHCGVEMNIWEVPPVPCDDGLGWGTPYLYMCFNDDCPLYAQGWNHIEENYGRTASYRCLCYPDSRKFECMTVFGPFGGTGQIVDDQAVAQQRELEEKIKAGMARLEEYEGAKDGAGVLEILMDATAPARVRVRAAELTAEIGDLGAVDPLRDHNFGNDIINKKVDDAVKRIHERFYTRECPFCAEIIKQRANICKHCGKDVAGR